MVLRELRHYLNNHKATVTFLVLHLTAFFVLVGTFSAFISELNHESKNLQTIYKDTAVYQLLDGYYDGEDYQKFISNNNYLNILKNFYKELNSTTDFSYLAMFNNPILLRSSYSLEQFAYSANPTSSIPSGTDAFSEVKSLQVNEKVSDFFKLETDEGQLFSNQAFGPPQDIMPIVLGYSYKPFFKVGDETEISYYGEKIKVQLVGILKKNSKIYYQHNPEFYLDDHVLIPYRSYDDPISAEDELFQRTNYFAMNNGYIVIENSPSASQVMVQRVESISKKTSFGSYSFINLNPHFSKYRGLLTVMLENKALAITIFSTALILNLIIISIMFLLQQKRRFSAFYIHYINGASENFLLRKQKFEIGFIFLLAYLISGIIISNIGIGKGDTLSLLYMFFLSLLMMIIIYILLSNRIKKLHFLKYNEDERDH